MNTRVLFLRFVLLTVAVVSFVSVPTIYAQVTRCDSQTMWGRPICRGYFTGVEALNGTTVFNDGPLHGENVNNRNQLIRAYDDYLNGSNQQHVIGAAATINIMLGVNGTQFGGDRQAGITYARANFNRWVQLVTDYDAQGLIDWSYSYPTSGVHLSSGYDVDAQDFYTQNSDTDVIEVIRFRNPNGNSSDDFFIDKWCGNIKGDGFVTPITYTIRGAVFIDGNKNGLQDRGEPRYNGRPTITVSRGTVTTNMDGTYTISNLTPGQVTVSYSSLPQGYVMTYPLNGPPTSFVVTVGPGCGINGARGASCQSQ